MSGFPILDLVAGIIFIFFLLSIICSSIVEIILTTKRIRGQVLKAWITGIFNIEVPAKIDPVTKKPIEGKQKSLGEEIIDHCALTGLSKAGEAPSYIDAGNFVSALLEKVTKYATNIKDTVITVPSKIEEYEDAIKNNPILPHDLQRTLLTYAAEARDTYEAIRSNTTKTIGELEMFRKKIENWYDTNMDRISGHMKKNYTRRFTMIAGIVTVLLLNADSIEISKYLYSNPQARSALAAQAYETANDDSIKKSMEIIKKSVPDTSRITVDQAVQEINGKLKEINAAKAALNESIPLGWNKLNPGWENVPYWFIRWLLFIALKIVGLAVTVLAIMMGAPFWFDVLNKISNLRSAGAKPPSSTDKDAK